jgi:hypothetical protein
MVVTVRRASIRKLRKFIFGASKINIDLGIANVSRSNGIIADFFIGRKLTFIESFELLRNPSYIPCCGFDP